MPNQYVIVGAASVVSAAVGAISGFFVAKRILEPKYIQVAEEEIEDAKEYYSRLYKKDTFANPVDLVNLETAEALMENLEYVAKESLVEEETPINSDELAAMEAIYEQIEISKEHGHPYIISRDEYMSNGSEYTQLTLTYFEDDDILVDSDDTVIAEVDYVVGVGQLAHFGVLSGDNNVLYIRSSRDETDFEIVKNKGNYAKDVLGFIEHADHTKIRRFRRDYE